MKNKKIYYFLIGTFSLLYLLVAFVSTLHAVTFFKLANSLGLAILLGIAYEVGQAAVLFSILLTEHKERKLPWIMMFLLTSLQISANVFASYKYMIETNTTDWKIWQQSILFGVQAESTEMYQVIIAWIIGALLPIVALGMTALVADNIHLLKDKKQSEKIKPEELKEIEEETKEILDNIITTENKVKETTITKEPSNKIRGWHLMDKFVDNDGNIFKKGKFIYQDTSLKPTEQVKKKIQNKINTNLKIEDNKKPKTNKIKNKSNIIDGKGLN
jgi:hypothetical protein